MWILNIYYEKLASKICEIWKVWNIRLIPKSFLEENLMNYDGKKMMMNFFLNYILYTNWDN